MTLEKPKLRNKNLMVVVDGQLVPETQVPIPQKVMRKGSWSNIPRATYEAPIDWRTQGKNSYVEKSIKITKQHKELSDNEKQVRDIGRDKHKEMNDRQDKKDRIAAAKLRLQ